MPKRGREASPDGTVSRPPEQHSADHEQTDTSAPTKRYLQAAGQAYDSVMKCSLPPHQEVIAFNSFEEFEIHYAKAHANRCSECKRNFPTDHFLNIHIRENHDPLSEARKARGEKIYSCFVEDCDKTCSSSDKRRMHLIDKHAFPKNYDFAIVDTGIDKRSSMLRTGRRRASHTPAQLSPPGNRDPGTGGGEASQSSSRTTGLSEGASGSQPQAQARPEVNQALDDITASMSALKFVPTSVRFGRGGRRGGFSRS